ncbi:hypothetical protein ILP97_47970 [Amycolatopsis sp. H6(2020)]|nr:hypothetical protein [Amycolatopsis sp. H6(2020)]
MDEDYARKLRNWLRAGPEATPRGASEEREWLREMPEPATDEQAGRWTVRGQLPQTPAADDWVCPVIALPVPRPSRENGCRISGIELSWSPPADAGRMSDAEARSRWNHPTNADRRAGAPASPEADTDARSRWNHPTSWHRRRRAAEDHRRDQPGSH